jgi:Uma2 family endonuclease
MSQPYEEILEGRAILRPPPGVRHEVICSRLHDCVRASVADLSSTRLLERRAQVKLTADTTVSPDLALVAAATGKLWLAAEIVGVDDHRFDTVVKKQIYEEAKLPRLWMIDPRYDNVEIYHAGAYGMTLKQILAGKEILAEKLLPEFEIVVAELFASAA